MNEENEEFEREINYKPPSQVAMEAQAREFADGQEEEEEIEIPKYITVLDSEVSRVFQYVLWHIPDNADDNTYERFLNDSGHNLTNCQWMVHDQPHVWARHNVEQIEANRFYNYNVNTIAIG